MQLENFMKTSFELVAEFRETQGKGASRRLRHEGKVPAILYGGHADARALTLNHQKLLIMLENERFYSTILNLKVGEQTQAAILKDVQRHPFKNAVVHIDFQRVEDNEKIRISIPLHFTGAAVSPGVKSQGGIVSHMRNEVEVTCLPKDLPEFIEVDISGLSLNESIHLSQLKVPAGVTLVELAKEDAAVVAIHSPRAEEPEPTAAAAAGAPAAEGAAAAPAAAAPAGGDAAKKADPAKKAEPAKKEEAKKEPAKKDAKK
jgi:large subunit ribosomal protein L25